MSSRTDVRAFVKCRNERLRLPAFFRHYRTLGVNRFFVVDNGSTDGSAEYLAAQSDVELSQSDGGLGSSRGGADWLNPLLAKFGTDSWCVTVDIDELLVYPGSEHTPLPQFTRYLDDRGCQALLCLLLDLYPSGRMQDVVYEPGDDMVAAAPYFDPGPYSRVPGTLCPGVVIRGGLRERVFYPERRRRGIAGRLTRLFSRAPAPCLTKVPLVRWTDGCVYLHSNHWVSPRAVAEETGVLLHCKFLHDFPARARREAARGEYEDGAAEYRRYASTLRGNPDLTLVDEHSIRYESTDQLVRAALMRDSDAWARRRAGGYAS